MKNLFQSKEISNFSVNIYYLYNKQGGAYYTNKLALLMISKMMKNIQIFESKFSLEILYFVTLLKIILRVIVC